MTGKQRLRYELFNEGCRILRSIGYQDAIDMYVCPICTRAFRRKALPARYLTIEHTPPKSLGGKAVSLTCKKCNNVGGSTVDAALFERMAFLRKANAILGSSVDADQIDAEVTLDGISLNARIDSIGSQRNFYFPEGINNPHKREAFFARLHDIHEKNEWSETSTHVQLKKGFHRQKAAVGYLRSAFLLGFATWGYSFAINDSTAMIRAQIMRPDEDLIHGFLIYPDREMKPGIGMMKEPIICAAIVVLDAIVLIPGPNDIDTEFYAQLPRRLPSGNLNMQFTFRTYPERPEYNSDRRVIMHNEGDSSQVLRLRKYDPV